MAIYFPNQVPSTGQKAGEAFSGGIGNALNMLAQQKLAHVQQRNHASQLGQTLESLGIPAQVGTLPESIQQAFIKQHLAAPQQQAFAQALSSILGGEQQQTEPEEQAQNVNPALPQNSAQKAPGIAIPKGLNQQQTMQLANIGLKQQQFLSKQQLEQQKRNDRKQIHWDKETAPVYKETSDLAKVANDSDMRLSRMEELNNSGNLNAPGFEAALKIAEEGLPFGMRIDLSSLRNADTQEFNKLSTDFLKDAKKFFGARITDNEVKLFLRTVPSMVNTPEGRRRVIHNLRMFNQAARTRSEVMDNIIEENNGERPRNLSSLIEKRSKPKLDAIAQQFKTGLKEMKVSSPINEESASLLSGIGGGVDNPLDIVNALSSAKNKLGGFLSGLWGS